MVVVVDVVVLFVGCCEHCGFVMIFVRIGLMVAGIVDLCVSAGFLAMVYVCCGWGLLGFAWDCVVSLLLLLCLVCCSDGEVLGFVICCYLWS